jgi:phosphatidylglycerophosphate synthase
LEKVRRAIVLGGGPGARTVVGGLPIAVRAVLALHEAGFDDVGFLVPGRPRWVAEPLARRGISIRWVEEPSAETAPRRGLGDALTLLLAGDVLVDAAAVASLRGASPGPVWTSVGHLVGVVCFPAEVARCLDRADLWTGSPGPGARIGAGLAVPLGAVGAPGCLERTLLDHLADRPTGDSYLAVLLDRPMSRPLTRFLLRTPLTPTHVTLLGVATGLLGAAGLATVSYWGRLGGVLLLLASIVLDCVDGDMARAQLAQNPGGARLDVLGDYVVHAAVFAGLATGLLREGLPARGAWAALALLTGVGAAMTAVHVLFVRPALRRGGDLHWAGDSESLRGRPGASIAEKLASRDYTYLLLVLALIGRLEWFLYAAAGGAWVFTAALIAYRFLARPRRGREAVSR